MEVKEKVLDFRLLQANEIRVREGQKTKTTPQKKALLLYKDARADMERLDEQFGSYGWQREHKDVHGVTYCGVSIWDSEHSHWVTKWDAGEPSNTSPQKGEASDSFKRACVNWGIGRELYTAPRIYVDLSVNTYDLVVLDIDYDKNRKICRLTIADSRGNIIYQMRGKNAPNAAKTPIIQNPTPQPQQENKQDEQLEAIFDMLSEREMAEYDEICMQMKASTSREQMVQLYNRYTSATFAPLLLTFGGKIIKERGW